MNIIRYWNDLALRLVANDHTGTPILGNQAGPTRTSRALAIIHLAMHDVVAVIEKFDPYLKTGLPTVTLPISLPAAVSAAAHATARALYPAQTDLIDLAYEGALIASPPGDPGLKNGTKFGNAVACALLKDRHNDGANAPEDYQYLPDPGKHRPDPHSPGQQVLGSQWGNVKPFTYAPGAHPPLDPPPPLVAPKYLAAYNEVYKDGRDSLPHDAPQKAMKGIFWAYDGAQKLGTPPRLYNQIVRMISEGKSPTVVDDARLFALINVGMADAGIACWHYKYVHNFWRPVVGIREGGPGSGPSMQGSGNPAIAGDPFWCPLGAPDTNGNRPRNFTPNFPAYPSGHSTFGATCFLLVGEFYAPESITFKFVSDELNGKNRDSTNVVRPLIERKFNLKTAIQENAQSRVYLGVHWQFDATEGIALGKKIVPLAYKRMGSPKPQAGAKREAAIVTKSAPQPLPGRRDPHR